MDANAPTSAQAVSEFEPQHQIMNTIDHRQHVDGFIDSFDPLEEAKRTIEPKA